MDTEKELQPGKRPLDIEMAFGDPEALEKAVENISAYPYCIRKDVHCPWIERCGSDLMWQCPIDIDERSRIEHDQSQIANRKSQIKNRHP